ncbi:unnamed protein product [Merluccius merluccius]
MATDPVVRDWLVPENIAKLKSFLDLACPSLSGGRGERRAWTAVSAQDPNKTKALYTQGGTLKPLCSVRSAASSETGTSTCPPGPAGVQDGSSRVHQVHSQSTSAWKQGPYPSQRLRGGPWFDQASLIGCQVPTEVARCWGTDFAPGVGLSEQKKGLSPKLSSQWAGPCAVLEEPSDIGNMGAAGPAETGRWPSPVTGLPDPDSNRGDIRSRGPAPSNHSYLR